MLCACAALAIACAQATPISKQLGQNPDDTRDTANPCVLSDGSDCKAPAGASVAWNQSCLNTALGPQNSVIVGTPVDASVEACASGTDLASATMSVVLASDGSTNCNATNLSITGSQPNRKLHNSATGSASGTCKLKLTYMSNSALSGTFPWTNSPAGGSDGTPPSSVTGLVCTTGDTLASTCTFDAQMDFDDAVTRTGVASYKVYSDLTWIDSLAAASPGLTCDFTPQTFGAAVSGSPSATQGTSFSGGQWTVNARGYGLQTADSYYGVSCPVAGSSVYAIARIDSISAGATYNKAIVDIRNGTSSTAAHYACVVMRQVVSGATTYYLQRTYRAADGGNNSTGATVQLAGSPPYYVRASDVSNLGACDYSTDGGPWTTVIGGDPITLNDAKLAVAGGSATTSGADDAAETVVFGSMAVQTAGRLSKTVTLTAGTHSLGISSVDVTGNESGITAFANVTAASGGSVTHKWNPGYYVRAHSAHLNCGTACDSQRHTIYSQFWPEANVVGTEIWIDWKALEGDSGNDFTAGIAWLTNEIAYINTNYPGKKIGLLLDLAVYGPSSLAGAPTYFPQYLINANCLYMELDAGVSGGSDTVNWKKFDPTCLGYYQRLIAAYGAAFDGNSTLAFIRVQQETDDAAVNGGGSGTAEDTAWRNIAQATTTAFPTTPVWISWNWGGVGTAASVVAEWDYFNSVQAGWGDGDTLPAPKTGFPWGYNCPSTATGCVIRGLSGASTYDYCGNYVAFSSVELSEMGYHSVGGTPGLTSAQVVDVWNSQRCVQYGIWEPNFNEVQDKGDGGASQYWNGAIGQKYQIDNNPITHTAKPAGYN